MLQNKNSSDQKNKLHLTKKQSIGLAVLLVALLGFLSYWFIFKKDSDHQVPISQSNLKSKDSQTKIYSQLTGLEVTEEQANRPVTAVIIENHTSARPQSGLHEAGVVYEAIAEGGITRFATLYQESAPKEVGPVRSLRPYLLDWLRPYPATISHVGGSRKALGMVRDGSWRDMDQFANGKSFWRSKDRKAPHNVYTNFEQIDKFNQGKNYTSQDFSSFKRKSDQKSSSPSATTINLNISSAKYNAEFRYSPEGNSYQRHQGGEAHLDKSGTQIEPKVIIAIVTNYSIVQEDGSRSAYKTIGSGEAVVFQDGVAQNITWSKPTNESPLSLKDADGKEVELNRGQTWITFLNSSRKIAWR